MELLKGSWMKAFGWSASSTISLLNPCLKRLAMLEARSYLAIMTQWRWNLHGSYSTPSIIYVLKYISLEKILIYTGTNIIQESKDI